MTMKINITTASIGAVESVQQLFVSASLDESAAGTLAAALFQGSENATAVTLVVGSVSNVSTVTTVTPAAPAAVVVVRRSSRISTLLALLCLLCCVPAACCVSVHRARAARRAERRKSESAPEDALEAAQPDSSILAATQPFSKVARMQGIMSVLSSRKHSLQEAVDTSPRVSRASSNAADQGIDGTAQQQLLELLRSRRRAQTKPTRLPDTPITVSAFYDGAKSDSSTVAAAVHAVPAASALGVAPVTLPHHHHEDDAPAASPAVVRHAAATLTQALVVADAGQPEDTTRDLELGLLLLGRDDVEPRRASGEGQRHETVPVLAKQQDSIGADDVETGRSVPPSRLRSSRARTRSSTGGRGRGSSSSGTNRMTAASRLARSQSAPPSGVQWKH
jgi:hypothetical protein